MARALKTRVTVRDRDMGWKKLRRILNNPLRQHVEIGVRGEDGSRNAGGISNVQIATIHEFGAPEANIPERSFIRSTVDTHIAVYAKLTKTLSRKVYTLKMPLPIALGLLGVKVAADMQRQIRNGISPALKQATVDRKGSSKPLIDTGQLVQAITSKVTR